MAGVIHIVLASIAALWLFWGLYVLVMGIYRAHLAGRLKGLALLLSLPFVAIGYIMDVLMNITLASIAFAEPPRELLVTARLQRHIKQSSGWRFRLAEAICDHLLDVFDPTGNHC